MDSSISMLRLFSVLVVFLALVTSLFARQVGASAAQGAADAAAVAVADSVSPKWDCTHGSLPADVLDTAARAVVDRMSQFAAAQPTAVDVGADGTCSVLVSVRVSSNGWFGAGSALAIACRRPASSVGAALRAPVAPAC